MIPAPRERRRFQPQYPVEPTDKALGKDVVGLWYPPSPWDAVSQTNWALTGSASLAGIVTPYGIGFGATASSSWIDTTRDIAFGGTAPITIAAAVFVGGTATLTPIVCQSTEVVLRSTVALTTGIEFILNSFTANDRATVTGLPSVLGTLATFGGSYGPSGKLRAWRNGVKVGEVTPSGTYANVANTFKLCGESGQNFIGAGNAVLIAAIVAAEWSEGEFEEFHAYPWQLLQDRRSPMVFLPTVTAGAIDLTASAAVSATSLAGAALTQAHALTAASETSATAASTGALSQVHALGAANAASDAAASTAALTQAHQLTSAVGTSATAASSPAVTQTHALAADNAASDTALSDPSLPLAGVLQAANAVTETSTSTPALTQEHGLTAAAAQSATAAAAPVLTQVHALAADPAQSDTALQAVGVTVQSDLLAANATSTTQSESPAVTQVHELGASNAASATVTTAPSIQIVLPGNPTYVQRLGISMLDRNKAATVTIFMMDSTDHLSGKIGLTLSLSLSKAGGAFSPITRDVLEVGIGAYLVSLTDADTDTAGALILRATATGADDGLLIADVSEDVDLDVAPQKAMRLMLAALAGQGAGFGTSLETFKNVAGDKTRFTSTVDAVGNRIVTLGDLS